MREPLTEFIQAVRAEGVRVSVAESIDALHAAGAVRFEREELREALAAALVKDELDRPAFDEVFARFFSAGDEGSAKRRRRAAAGAGPGRAGSEPSGAGPPQRAEHSSFPSSRSEERARFPSRAPKQPSGREGGEADRLAARRRVRALFRKPFREMDEVDAEALSAFAAELARRFRARLRRRRRRGRRGRLDFRRTLRRSIVHGGAPFELAFRRRRPARIDLCALCDVSGSVRHASELFVSLLAPCREFFRRFRVFVFVDRPVEATIEDGRLVPHAPIDFHAFSDFGRTLVELEQALGPSIGRSTVLVVLGDARTNRRPPRADVLRRLRARARALWWLVPERTKRWGRGDSAIDAYRPSCDVVLECASGEQLLAAIARLAR